MARREAVIGGGRRRDGVAVVAGAPRLTASTPPNTEGDLERSLGAGAARLDRLAAARARKLERQRARRRSETRIDYRPSQAAQRVLAHYRAHGLTIDEIIDALVVAVGIRPICRVPEDIGRRRR
jgi:hypothetical protein